MIGFIDVATAELAKLVDYVITYPANEQLKFYMVADRFMYNAGEFPEYEDLYKELLFLFCNERKIAVFFLSV